MKLFGMNITRDVPAPVQTTEEQLQVISSQIAKLQGNDDQTTRSGIFNRLNATISGGYDFGDTMHNIYLDCGYPAQLTFFNYWNMYRRGGIAKNVVELIPDTCWSSAPTIESEDKTFERDVGTLVDNLKMWQRLKGLDTRNRVGTYAGLFMRVKDGKEPSEELTGKLPGVNTLTEMVPLYESQLQVLTTEQNAQSERFGLPLTYQLNTAVTGTRDPMAATSITIHWTRIIIAAEGADNGGIYGISSLEAPYNSLMDLRKISGAGAEGFYKNAAQNIIFELANPDTGKIDKKLLENFNKEYDEWSHNRMRRGFMAPGMNVHALQSTLVNPKDFFFNALYDVAAATKIPVTILIGQLTGKLASDEDTAILQKMCQSRRMNWLIEMISSVLDWCIQFGILPTAKYEIVWDDLLAASDDQKLKNADTMAGINEKQFKSGGGVVFDDNTIRVAAGFDEEPEPDDRDSDETLEDEEELEEVA